MEKVIAPLTAFVRMTLGHGADFLGIGDARTPVFLDDDQHGGSVAAGGVCVNLCTEVT